MEINKNIINLIKRNSEQFKQEKFMQNVRLQKEFFTSLKNYEFQLLKQSSYEIALWIESNEKHLLSINQNSCIDYGLGEILLIDLGWNNYDREFSYIHPAIVIKNTPTKIFIVPCSSSDPRKNKFGQIYPEFEVRASKDGFLKDSIVMLYEAKYVDKNRVVTRLGHVSNSFFQKIYTKLFSQIFEPFYYQIKNFHNK